MRGIKQRQIAFGPSILKKVNAYTSIEVRTLGLITLTRGEQLKNSLLLLLFQ
jgi:hypothetical protein